MHQNTRQLPRYYPRLQDNSLDKDSEKADKLNTLKVDVFKEFSFDQKLRIGSINL